MYRNYYFPAKPIQIPGKWVLLRNMGKEKLTVRAQEKLEWIIFYHTMADKKVKATAGYFGITRKTLHKWLSRFDERNLLSLEEESRRPDKTREWEVTLEEEEHIKTLRKKNMELGKAKLKRLYKTEYHEEISTWKIERVVRKWNLYPQPVEHAKKVEKRRKSASKVRIHTVKKQLKTVQDFGFLWHIDAIIIWWYGERRILFTAIEDKTKIAFARVYKTNTSTFAKDFLVRLMYLVEGRVEIMHSDNGSEFQGEFEKACSALNILQIYSRPYTPKDNPSLERFNNTVQYEWLQYSETGLTDVQEANTDLTTWLIKYNSYRPHQALDYLTPLAYAEQNFKVSPMSPASTSSLQ